MSWKAIRIKPVRRLAELTITPRFPCHELIVVFVFSKVAFRPPMTWSSFLELGDHI